MENRQRKFRACIFVDIFVDEGNDLEQDREQARKELVEQVADVPNSYSDYRLATMNELIENPDVI